MYTMHINFTIGNPPYEGRNFLYTKILYVVSEYSDNISWLCPTTFIDGVYKRNDTFNRVIATFKKTFNAFEDVDPSGFDMQVAQKSLGIFNFNKRCTNPVDMDNLCWRFYESPEKIKGICKKIQNYCQEKNLYKNRLAPKKVIGTAPQPDPNFKCNPDKWYVGCSWVRGTNGDWTWITLVGEKDLPIKGDVIDTWFHAWQFDTKELADSFRNYLNNSDILKFSVHLEKINQTNNPGDFKFFPESDLPWSEKNLQEKIGLTDEEMVLIKKILKSYEKK